MSSIELTNTKKKEMTANEMVIKKLHDQMKYQGKILILQQ